MQRSALSDERAESLIVRAMENNIINTQEISKVLSEWRKPSYEDFEKSSSYWRLFNSFTTAMGRGGESNPNRYAVRTMKLSAHLVPQDAIALAT